MASSLQSLRYSNANGVEPHLEVLDQLLVPKEKKYIPIADVESAWQVIRTMQIRGAPLIAIVGCLGLAVDLSRNPKAKEALASAEGLSAAVQLIKTKTNYLRTSRPTAVNLFNALDELEGQLDALIAAGSASTDQLVKCVIDYAEMMLKRDVADNEAIGCHGADAILAQMASKGKSATCANMVTICNTGSLATAGYGTALGVARALHAKGKLKSITALETRPYNQGSRLTAFEITEEQMPGGTLICDSAAAFLMKTKGVDACVVGADRVCANGDTANKIGTYELAIVAAYHGVPFYVAAPFTTLDISLASGDLINIEERPASELLESARAPESIGCWNPGFDVTPAKLITGIVTEKGVIEKSEDGTIDVASFVHDRRTPGEAAAKRQKV